MKVWHWCHTFYSVLQYHCLVSSCNTLSPSVEWQEAKTMLTTISLSEAESKLFSNNFKSCLKNILPHNFSVEGNWKSIISLLASNLRSLVSFILTTSENILNKDKSITFQNLSCGLLNFDCCLYRPCMWSTW